MYRPAARVAKLVLVPSNCLVLFAVAGIILRLTNPAAALAGVFASACIGVLILFSLFPVGDLLLNALQTRFPRFSPDGGDVSGIIVLGGVVSPFGLPSSIQWAPTGAVGRLFETVKLAGDFPNARVLVSAGPEYSVGTISEADGIARYLTEMGVSSDRLLLEHRSRDTFENARYSYDLAKPEPHQRWLLVTSSYHMPRAMGCFRKAGFNVVAAPAERQIRLRHSLSVSRNLSRLDLATKEFMGLAVYRILRRTSVFLGAP